MKTDTVMSRLDRLDRMIKEKRIIRALWSGKDKKGRKTACLLVALSPEVGATEDANACPAEVMPQWLAGITPLIDDEGTLEHWPEVIRRYASLARRWHVLSTEEWSRLDYRVRELALRKRARHAANVDAKLIDAYAQRAAGIECDCPPSYWQEHRAAYNEMEQALNAVARKAREDAYFWTDNKVREVAADYLIDVVLDALEAAIEVAEKSNA